MARAARVILARWQAPDEYAPPDLHADCEARLAKTETELTDAKSALATIRSVLRETRDQLQQAHRDEHAARARAVAAEQAARAAESQPAKLPPVHVPLAPTDTWERRARLLEHANRLLDDRLAAAEGRPVQNIAGGA